jgi:hypothetical protein
VWITSFEVNADVEKTVVAGSFREALGAERLETGWTVFDWMILLCLWPKGLGQ